MAFTNQETSFTIPAGATSGPRVVIDGDEGTITVYGATDDDKILIDPSGPNGKPIINFQDSDAPGDLFSGIEWEPANGLVFRGWPYVEQEYGETVRAYLKLNENAIRLGFIEAINNNLVGGAVSLDDNSATFAFVNHAGVVQYGLLMGPDGLQLVSHNTSLVEWQHYEGTNSTTGGGTAAYLTGAANFIEFVAPATGAVKIKLEGWLANNSATAGRRSYLSTRVREGTVASPGATTHATDDTMAGMKEQQVAVAGFKYGYVSCERWVTGLVPGDPYHVHSMFRCDNAADQAAVHHRKLRVEPMYMGVGV